MKQFFATMDKLRPLYDVTDKIVMTICKVLLIADICISGYSVAGRYLPFIDDPSWTEEVVLTLMSYMAVLSAAIAITIGARGTYVSMPNVSRFWMYFPVPLAGIAMIVFELECIYEEIRGICLKEDV